MTDYELVQTCWTELANLSSALADFPHDLGQWPEVAGFDGNQPGLLRRGLECAVRIARELPEVGIEDPTYSLEQILASLAASRTAIREYCRLRWWKKGVPVPEGSTLDREADWTRDWLYANARRLTMSALIVVLAYRIRRASEGPVEIRQLRELLLRYCWIASDAGNPPQDANVRPSENWMADDVNALIDACFATVPGRASNLHCAAAWTSAWLNDPAKVEIRWRTVPVAGVDSTGTGFMADLTLELLDQKGAGVIPHPEMALVPVGQEFARTIEKAGAAAWGRPPAAESHVVRWAYRRKGSPPSVLLHGDSHDGAAQVGMEVLKRDLPYDSGFIVVATVGPEDVLARVGEEGPKLEAARDAGLERALIGHDSELTDAYLASLRPLDIIR